MVDSLPNELFSSEHGRDCGAAMRGLRPAPVRQEDRRIRRVVRRHQRQNGGQSIERAPSFLTFLEN